MSATPEFVGGPRFEVRRRLGAGGFGIVYEVYDHERRAEVALKALARLDAPALYRFKREFRAIADVRHKNLVELHELVSVGDEWFLVMELVRGGDALTWAGNDHARLRIVLRQLAEGLVALHAAGRLHRDVKPSNVLVEEESGRVVIVDFGITADLDPEGGTRKDSDMSLLAGTPEYMAPEQGTGDTLTTAADWYAMGVFLFEALTGRLPFVGGPLQILLDKQRFEAPNPSEIRPGIPQDLATLCVDLLRTRPDARPKGSEVLRRLGVTAEQRAANSGVRSATTRADRMLLVGRESELEELASAYERARSGRPTTVVVSGRSGMGKTALVQAFLESVRDEAIVLAGRCYERESVPYKALDAVIDELSRTLLQLPANEAAAVVPRDVAALVRLFPVLQRAPAIAEAPRRVLAKVEPLQLRMRGFVALRELLARLSDRRPLVIFIDDLQWGDADSAALLTELAAPPDAPSFLLVASHRSEDVSTSAPLKLFLASDSGGATKRSEEDVRMLHLAPLAREHVRALASTLLGPDAPPSLVDGVAEESRGAPILVRELVDNVQADGSALSSTLRLEVLFRNRLRALPDSARRLLEVLSVAGRPLRLEHAMAAASLSGDARREALDVLRVGRLVRAQGTRGSDLAEPYHDRVREAVLVDLDPEALRETHATLARALQSSGDADPEALFVHWSAAGATALAAQYVEEAADNAARALAFDRAAELYRRALDFATDPARVTQLQESLGDALANAGRGAEAADAYLAAAPQRSGMARIELERRASEQLLVSGHVDRGMAIVTEVLEHVGLSVARSPRAALLALFVLRVWIAVRGLRFRERDAEAVPPRTLARIDVAWSTAAGLAVVDNIRAAHFQTRNLLLCLSAGEPTRLLRALVLEAIFVALPNARKYGRSMQIVAEVRELARRHPTHEADALVHLAEASTAYFSGRWAHAVEHVDRFLELYHDGGVRLQWELRSIQYFGLCARIYRGDLLGLSQRLPAYLREAQDRGDLYFGTNLYVGETNLHWLLADDPLEARRVVMAAMERWSKGTVQVQHWYALQSLAQIDLYTGEVGDTLERVERMLPAVRASMLLRVQHTRVKAVWLRARCAIATALGRNQEPLLARAEEDARSLEREAAAWALGFATLVRAGIAGVQRREDDANAALRRAIEQFDTESMPLFAMAARLRLGERLADPTKAGRVSGIAGDEGSELVARARAWMDEQGVRAPERLAAMLAPGV